MQNTQFIPNTVAMSLKPDTILGAVGYQNNKKNTEDKEIVKYYTQFHHFKLMYLVFFNLSYYLPDGNWSNIYFICCGNP